MPNTTNIHLNIPNTGDLPGAWGTTAVNANMVAIDGMFGGALTLALAAATSFALTTPGSVTPGAGPVQSQNALIKLTGTLSGNAVIQLGMPGRYVFDNRCVVGSNYVQITSSGGGVHVGLPPGQKTLLFHDGTDVDFVNAQPVGAALDLHQSLLNYPAWMLACSVQPYLYKDGTVYNISTYPALGAMLGSTFGGNGATTFGVPDERGRVRAGIDLSLGTRLDGSAGVNASIMGSAGGNQDLQAHGHTVTVTDPQHHHGLQFATFASSPGANTYVSGGGGSTNTANAATGITASADSIGSGNSQNVQPCIVSMIPLIKT